MVWSYIMARFTGFKEVATYHQTCFCKRNRSLKSGSLLELIYARKPRSFHTLPGVQIDRVLIGRAAGISRFYPSK